MRQKFVLSSDMNDFYMMIRMCFLCDNDIFDILLRIFFQHGTDLISLLTSKKQFILAQQMNEKLQELIRPQHD